MQSGTLIAILTLLAVPVGVFGLILLLLRRVGGRAERRADELRAEVERLGECWVLPLQGAAHRSARHTDARPRGNGVLGLTTRRLLFEPIVGERLSIPVVRLRGARAGPESRGAATAGRRELVLVLDDDTEVAFLVRDEREWLRGLAACGVAAGEGAAEPPDAPAEPPDGPATLPPAPGG
ncbi:MAG: hypothetical protein WC709_10790 [Thermoleophilia bacterium]